MAAALDEKGALEAKAHAAAARCSSMGEKVRVARDAQLHAAQTIEQRESELRNLQRELNQTQAQLAAALERELRERGGAR